MLTTPTKTTTPSVKSVQTSPDGKNTITTYSDGTTAFSGPVSSGGSGSGTPVATNPQTGAALKPTTLVQSDYQPTPKDTKGVSPGSISPLNTSTPPNATTTSDASKPTEYTVAKGDTLSSIASKYGTNIQAIQALNPEIKNPNVISTGQTFKLPGDVTGTTSKSAANDYQNKIHQEISKVPDQNNVAAIGAAAGKVSQGSDQFTPGVQTSLDTLIGNLIPKIQEIISPTTHTTSLTEDYKSIASSLGIDTLNTQLMNVSNIINGTPDDIRAEVTKAGGFMSESQVQALSAARNKVLIQQANMLQEQITTKTNTLNTLIGLDEKDKANADAHIESATNLTKSLIDIQSSMNKNTTDNYQKIVTNVGYQGLASALKSDPYSLSLAEKSLGLPTGTLSNPTALKSLETYRQQSLAQAGTRININSGTANALEMSRYSTIVNSTIKTLYPTNKNPIQLYNNSSQVINRVDEAAKLSLDPKVKDKAAPDLDLIDAYVSIARGGQQITEAQVDTLLAGLGVKAKFDVGTQKIIGTGTLDNGTRKSLATLSHKIYDGQKKLADEAVGTINNRLTQLRVPQEFQFASPNEVPTDVAPQNSTSNAGPGSTIFYNGQQYTVGADGESLTPVQ